ncbi:MAG: LarC family nickel insertion protein, partial [Alphaproteobacteria bacterium]|nr:LarC family nickel insertion protein [Alphaproteobacteria bacterium]
MKVLFFDPQSGASGDMIMGCLLDLGADPEKIIAAVESVNCRLEISRTKKHSIVATKAHVIADGRYHSVEEAKTMLNDACLVPPAREIALSTLVTLADAEAEVHGTSSDQVHFHEIGALDALADIAGCCAAFHSLEVEKTFTLPISVGSGTVSTMHGLLPVPAPATMAVLQSSGLLWKGGPIKQELLTPTGAALLANLVDEVIEEYPMIRAERVGYGAGSKDSEMPN